MPANASGHVIDAGRWAAGHHDLPAQTASGDGRRFLQVAELLQEAIQEYTASLQSIAEALEAKGSPSEAELLDVS